MYHNLFRITLLSIAIAIILAACAAPISPPALATKAPIATEAVPTATEIPLTNTPEATATQIVLGVFEGTIAFRSSRTGNDEIYVMKGDGSELINLTNNSANDWHPSWSPDGTQITFSSERDGNAEIYVMNADGSGQIRLTDNPAGDEIPVWQP